MEQVMATQSILIVDDDQAICELIRDGLAGRSYSCDIATSADEALTKLKSHHYDVALLDIMLPGTSGIRLLTAFKAISRNIKILMITAVNDLETAIQAMKLGASDYIVKPFTIDKLNDDIDAALRRPEIYSPVCNAIEPLTGINYGSTHSGASSSAITALACGVDAQVDYFDFHSKIVTERTIDVARHLDLPAKEIEDWLVQRNDYHSKRDSYIKSALSKLERSAVAQAVLGLTRSIDKKQE
jgi:DNA-binding response OmpR family regulator